MASTRFGMRIPVADKAMIERAAREAGVTLSEFVLEAAKARSLVVLEGGRGGARKSLLDFAGAMGPAGTATLEDMQAAIELVATGG